MLAVDLAYWQQTVLKVVGVLAAVLLPGRASFVYVFLFKMMSFMQSRLGPMEAGPHGSLQLARRGRQVPPEGGHRPRPGRPPRLQAWRRSSC